MENDGFLCITLDNAVSNTFFLQSPPPKKHTKKMSAATSKIQRTANAPTTPPDEIELSVAQAFVDLENNMPELKTELRPLQISAAREVDVRGGKKAIVVFVPVPQVKAFRKVQQRYFSFFKVKPSLATHLVFLFLALSTIQVFVLVFINVAFINFLFI